MEAAGGSDRPSKVDPASRCRGASAEHPDPRCSRRYPARIPKRLQSRDKAGNIGCPDADVEASHSVHFCCLVPSAVYVRSGM
uniref:Uncharacterized protein n=1 Tax=Triticum urartu TaxID=4572 RepID=A0A8R7P0E8_TRIUA